MNGSPLGRGRALRAEGAACAKARGREGPSGPQPRAGLDARFRFHRQKPLAATQGSQDADGGVSAVTSTAMGHLSLSRPASPSLSSSPQRGPAVPPGTVPLGGHSPADGEPRPFLPLSARSSAPAGPSSSSGRAVSPHAWGSGGSGGCCTRQAAGPGPRESRVSVGKGGEGRKSRRVHLLATPRLPHLQGSWDMRV